MSTIHKGETTISRGALICLMSRTHKMDEEFTPTARQNRGGGTIRVQWNCVNCGSIRVDLYNKFNWVLQDRDYNLSAEYEAARKLWDHRPNAAEVRALLYGNARNSGVTGRVQVTA